MAQAKDVGMGVAVLLGLLLLGGRKAEAAPAPRAPFTPPVTPRGEEFPTRPPAEPEALPTPKTAADYTAAIRATRSLEEANAELDWVREAFETGSLPWDQYMAVRTAYGEHVQQFIPSIQAKSFDEAARHKLAQAVNARGGILLPSWGQITFLSYTDYHLEGAFPVSFWAEVATALGMNLAQARPGGGMAFSEARSWPRTGPNPSLPGVLIRVRQGADGPGWRQPLI